MLAYISSFTEDIDLEDTDLQKIFSYMRDV